MDTLLQDLKYGVRLLFKSPAVSATAVLALALGIGANTSIFSLVNAMLLKPLPYENAERLVILNEKSSQIPNMSVSYLNFSDWRDQNDSFEHLAATRFTAYNLTAGEEPERLTGSQVSASLFPALGIRPQMGRLFTNADDTPGAEKVAIISHGLWQRRFGGDPQTLGSSLIMSGEPFTVIGIMPQTFRAFPQTPTSIPEVWTPIGLLADTWTARGNHPGIYCIALLKEGVTVASAQADLSLIAKRLEQEYPLSNTGNGVDVTAVHERVVGAAREPLLILLGAVGLVLLLACANVANLLLARAASRSKELALRAALGAGRNRIVRQMLTESVILALAGGALGILFAYWGINLLIAASPPNIPRIGDAGLDNTVLAFTAALSLATGLIFGLIPAVQSSRLDLNDSLKDSVRGSSGASGRMRSMLVISEVTVALTLLIGSGLLIKSFWHVQGLDPGYNAENVLAVSVTLPQSSYPDPESQRGFYNQIIDRMNAIPGVISAGTTTPLLGGWQTSFTVEGRPRPNPGEFPSADIGRVSPEYFKTMGIPLLKGRHFNQFDHQDAQNVIVIDEKFAESHFPHEEPIGQRLGFGPVENTIWREIVGVVGHVKNYGVDQQSRIEMYMPYVQTPVAFMNLVLKTNGNPRSLAAQLRKQVSSIDPGLPIYNVRTMEEILDISVAPRRLTTMLLTVFAIVALALASVGIYGVMSYSVSQQVREIGIMMALGAPRGGVMAGVVKRGMALVGIGLAVGLVAAFGLTKFMGSVLFGVEPTDPSIFIAVPAVLAAVALLATFLPARRAASVDPIIALRSE